jgi:hypothetical protein
MKANTSNSKWMMIGMNRVYLAQGISRVEILVVKVSEGEISFSF